MRTLVDLLNDERGYVRIYVEQEGFGYERSTYAPLEHGDLFDRMAGYASIANAREAAEMQLRALTVTKRRRGRARKAGRFAAR